MRHDGKRVVLYKYSMEQSEWCVLSPLEAVTLSLFDGKTNLQKIAAHLAILLNHPLDEVHAIIEQVIAHRYHSENPVLRAYRDCAGWRLVHL